MGVWQCSLEIILTSQFIYKTIFVKKKDLKWAINIFIILK